jgi:hypothetical protein
MGQFAEQFRDYEQYSDSECYRKSLPANAAGALADVLIRWCGAGGDGAAVAIMQTVANDLLAMAGKGPTTNWDAGALRAEIRAAFHILHESKFDKFMDATLNAFQRLYRACPPVRQDLLREVNDVLLTANIGYRVRAVGAERLAWEGLNEASAGVSSLVAAAEAVTDISQEALEHLEQARAHLLTPTSSRSRKDAVRDAMSAMEAMVKRLASDADLDKAISKLRKEGVWGNDQIVKDGHCIWGLLHRHHPDIRHGQATKTDIDLEEALYWIDRIAVYVRYMAARSRVLGR